MSKPKLPRPQTKSETVKQLREDMKELQKVIFAQNQNIMVISENYLLIVDMIKSIVPKVKFEKKEKGEKALPLYNEKGRVIYLEDSKIFEYKEKEEENK